jgi:hypothetical protein
MSQEELRRSIEDRIVHIVTAANAPFAPKELVSELRGEGFKEDRIRSVLWSLIDRNRIRVTREWKLTPSETNERTPSVAS